MENLRIIGTSHIAKQSIREIEEAFAEPPQIVCLELDRNRLYGLLHPNQKSAGFLELSRTVGVRGALFAVTAKWVQQRFGKQVGISPGSEMLLAFRRAREAGCQIALIDQPIELTLRNFSKAFTFKEKTRLAWDIVRSPFSKETVRIDLRKVPEKKLIETMLGQLRERYPSIYKVLLEDRNRYMARKLRLILDHNPDKKVLAIVGAGHVEGIAGLLTSAAISHSWSVSHTNI